MQPLLWDTCAAIWIYEKARLSDPAIDAMSAAHREGVPAYVSTITAWEVGMLVSRGRLQLLIRPERWFANLFDVPGVVLADLSPDVLIASSYLPGKPPKDPTDQSLPLPRANSVPRSSRATGRFLPTASKATSPCWNAEASRHCREQRL